MDIVRISNPNYACDTCSRTYEFHEGISGYGKIVFDLVWRPGLYHFIIDRANVWLKI
jgi:hypothetical protein